MNKMLAKQLYWFNHLPETRSWITLSWTQNAQMVTKFFILDLYFGAFGDIWWGSANWL